MFTVDSKGLFAAVVSRGKDIEALTVKPVKGSE